MLTKKRQGNLYALGTLNKANMNHFEHRLEESDIPVLESYKETHEKNNALLRERIDQVQ